MFYVFIDFRSQQKYSRVILADRILPFSPVMPLDLPLPAKIFRLRFIVSSDAAAVAATIAAAAASLAPKFSPTSRPLSKRFPLPAEKLYNAKAKPFFPLLLRLNIAIGLRAHLLS